MKTETKNQIIEIIKKNGPIRPFDLTRLLKISPQAIHKHLRNLVSEGMLELKGSPPSTQYRIAGIPDFQSAFDWFRSNKAKVTDHICETRDRFASRLNHFISIGAPEKMLPLIISASGEVGNNSFDHNMGQWKDIPGCWFEIQKTSGKLWVLIADRGQGIYRSLSQVVTNLDEKSAVQKAFEERLSGRAPEKRGNGLKFVRKLITENSVSGIACRSGRGFASYGEFGENCLNVLQSIPNQNFGTVTLMVWGIK